ncbi:chloride channel protein [Corallincola holothuriorum]|uniref:Chloride channel protein n=1 Tax=Corallincola holothuriorum TaxID=2282215 RepID=A0A368NN86_9GAMM|nr:chloride channel protein [Corallincola holothuriorum]RCU51616.1 chloride channel protein [Corallincola holothuriorum]
MDKLPLIKHLRYSLSFPSVTVYHCFMGLVGGISAATLILIFRFLVEFCQHAILGPNKDFTTLPGWANFILPLSGAALILILALTMGVKYYRLGIPFVIYRVKFHHGLIPLRNTINQFLGAALSLICGFSVGREGPAVHMGAAGSAMIGHYLRLPYNATRIMAASGIAAGISASFNTPLAAVIFVMEVVLREYKVHMFLPIMLASACGSIMSRLAFGESHTFEGLDFVILDQLHHVPFLLLSGVIIGCMAALFNQLLLICMRSGQKLPFSARILTAAIATGVLATMFPEIMGTEDASLGLALSESPAMTLLIGVFVGKMVATVLAIGLGIPGGIIGPLFALGGLAGMIALQIMLPIAPDLASHQGVYVVIGMASMMGASLNAPMAALVAILELTNTPAVIVPAMLVLISAQLVASQVFRSRSAFLTQMELQRLPYQISPVVLNLQKIGVQAVMRKDFVLLERPDDSVIQHALERSGDRPVLLINQGDQPWRLATADSTQECGYLLEPMPELSVRRTLGDVYEQLSKNRRGAVIIHAGDTNTPIGVVNWQHLTQRLHTDLG